MIRLLAETSSITATQWVLLALIVVLIVLYPVFTIYRNKKEREKFDQLAKDLKVGDKILTSSGTYGEIVSIDEREHGKVLTLKTGTDKHTGYLAVDILTVYSVFRDKPEIDAPVAERQVEQKAEPKAEKAKPAAKKTETKPATAKKAEPKPAAKKDSKK